MMYHYSQYYDKKIVYCYGGNDTPDDKDYPFHTHDCCELVMLTEGDISAVIGAKSYKLKKYDIVIFRTQELHRICIDSDAPYERYNILFDENKLANGIFEKIPKSIDIINAKNNSYVLDIFKKLDFYSAHFSENHLARLIPNLIEELVFNLSMMYDENSCNDYVYTNPIINKALKFIDANFTKPIELEDVCNELYISKRHLHHLFTQTFQISPKKYINSKRLAMAQTLIRSGTNPTEVYMLCGFCDYVTFYRNYKQYFGRAPSLETTFEKERKIQS